MVPGGGNCELTPFGKKLFASIGRNFNCRFMSGKISMGGLRDRPPRNPAMPTTAAPSAAPIKMMEMM